MWKYLPMTNSVADLLALAARDLPDEVAVVEATGSRRLTWAELDDETDRVVAGLGAEGAVAGYRVMIVLPNRIEFVTTYLGALRAQLVAVPVNPRSTATELARMLADSTARLVVADASTVDTVRQSLSLLEQARAGEFEGIDPQELAEVPTPG